MTYSESILTEQGVETKENNTVQTTQEYREEISGMIEQMFGTKPDFNDKRISESAKQI